MAWDNVFLENKFILYELGISNQFVEKFFKSNNINYIIVEDDHVLDENYVIIKSPGIDNDTKFLKKCIKRNLLIINDIELFYLLRPNLVYIGITGTCGKTTTCMVLYNIMKEKCKVKVCGNIGIPIFTYINESLDFLIIELSSYQLEWINKLRLNYFIILNVYDHHLIHHKTFNNYLNAKLNPLKNLVKDDVLILNINLNSYLRGRLINSKVFTFSKAVAIEKFKDYLEIDYFKYEFNIENFAAIYLLLKELRFEDCIIIDKIKEFKTLPHRMENIICNDNLVIINDSISTGFISLKEGIKYCVNNYPNYQLNIIIGGKLDLEEIRNNLIFIKSLSAYQIYCYGENGRLLSKIINCKYYKSIIDIINNLNKTFKQVILFSPAAQSFDQFNSFEERGNLFKSLILKKLKL